MTETTKPMCKTETKEQATRGWADILGIWRLCTKPACQRTRGCHGPIHTCFKAYFPLLPEGMQLWFAIICNAKHEGLNWDEALESMEGTPAEDALERWHQAITDAAEVMETGRRGLPKVAHQ